MYNYILQKTKFIYTVKIQFVQMMNECIRGCGLNQWIIW